MSDNSCLSALRRRAATRLRPGRAAGKSDIYRSSARAGGRALRSPALLVTAMAAAALAVAGAGTAAAAQGRAAQAPTCTDSWLFKQFQNVGSWTDPSNWSNGVPVSTSDVCIAQHVLVLAPASVTVHSLQVGDGNGVQFGNGKQSGHVAITTVLISGGSVEPDGVTLTAPSITITDTGDIASSGTSVVTSPALSLQRSTNGTLAGAIAVNNGTLTLTDPPAQLKGGALTGGTWQVYGGGTLRLPSDVSALDAGVLVLINDAGSGIAGPSGGNGLAGLTSIANGATLGIGNNGSLTVAGNLTSAGLVEVGSQYAPAAMTVGGIYAETTDGHGTVFAGTLTAGAVDVGSGAALAVLGTVKGPVTNAGTVQAAGNPTSVTGDYTQTAGGVLDIPFNFSALAVSGKATLAGALQTGSVPNSPTPGSGATLLRFGSRQGSFTSHSVGFKVITLANRIDVVAQPQIAAPSSAPAGGKVTVSGGDFQLASTVKIFLDSTSGTPLGTARPGLGGSFQQTTTIPAGTSTGSHTLIAVGSDGRTARQAIQVTAGR